MIFQTLEMTPDSVTTLSLTPNYFSPYTNMSNNNNCSNFSIPWNSTNTSSTKSSASTPTTTNVYYLNLTVGGVGVVGHFITIVVMFYHKPLRRKMVNYFFINQSIMDFMASLFMILANTVGTSLTPNFKSDVQMQLYCRLWISKVFYQSFFLSSLFVRAAVVVERYFQIVHPIQHRLKMTKGKVLAANMVCNLLGFALKSFSQIPINIPSKGTCIRYYPNSASQDGETEFHWSSWNT